MPRSRAAPRVALVALLAALLLALAALASAAEVGPNMNNRRRTTTRRRATTTRPGAYRTVSVKLRLFDDRNGNGRFDAGDVGYANRNIVIIRPQPKNVRYVRATLRTDAAGWARGRMVIMPNGGFIVARKEVPNVNIATFNWPNGALSPTLVVPLLAPRPAGTPVRFEIGNNGLSCGPSGCTMTESGGESFQPLCPPGVSAPCTAVYLKDSSGLCLGVRSGTPRTFTLGTCPTAPRRLMARQTIDFLATLGAGGSLCFPASGVCMGEEGDPVPPAQAPSFTQVPATATTQATTATTAGQATTTVFAQPPPTTTQAPAATTAAQATTTVFVQPLPTTTVAPLVPTTTVPPLPPTSTSTATPSPVSCARSTDCPVGTCVGGTPYTDVSAQAGVGVGSVCNGIGEGTGVGFSCSILVSGTTECGNQCAAICAAENLKSGNRLSYPNYAALMFNSGNNATFCGCAQQCGPVSNLPTYTTTFLEIKGICNASIEHRTTSTLTTATRTTRTTVTSTSMTTSTPGCLVNTYAGTGTAQSSGDGGDRLDASFFAPAGICLDASGNLYVVEMGAYRVRRIDKTTGIVTTFAGNGTDPSLIGVRDLGDGGPATEAALMTPNSCTFDPAGNMYITDTTQVRKVDTSGIISTVFNKGNQGFSNPGSGDGGPAVDARIEDTQGVAALPDGTVLIGTYSGGTIRSISSGGIAGTVANNTPDGFFALAPQGTGVLVSTLYTVRNYDPSNFNAFDPVAGTGSFGSDGNGGSATSASLAFPRGIALDAAGNIFLADSANNQIRVISAANGNIYAFAGIGSAESTGDGGPPDLAGTNNPYGVAYDGATGRIYWSEQDGARIRFASGPECGPPPAS
ncbi:hypothetical protein DFJ74DRAFT_759760 [Hyaloraphidium curvatum]|nr:hypothetical protein DFJ74DRAFT_759760 [Hyaloraphidium curvatum]